MNTETGSTPHRGWRYFYCLLAYLLTPILVLRLIWCGRNNRGYWQHPEQRFGFVPKRRNGGPLIWVHAVSVGEVQAARPLIERLREQHAEYHIMVTTTTPTGAQIVTRLFEDSVVHYYTPYDLPGVIHRFLIRTNPVLLVLIETELWPNMIHGCHARGVPVVLVNARISRRSFAGYQAVAVLARDTIRRCSLLAAQTTIDAERLIALGAEPSRVVETGNTKFDITIPPSVLQQGQSLRREFGRSRPVMIAASTHPGEEEIVLRAYARILARNPQCLLVSVPRHPERAARIADLYVAQGLNTLRRSSGALCTPDTHIYLVDTIGELPMFYAASDIAFVGGSLVPVGGHNLLEPAGMGLAVLTGPHIDNFAEIGRLLGQAGAVSMVRDETDLVEQACQLLENAESRTHAGDQGKTVVAANRGAVDEVMAALTPFVVRGKQTSHRAY